MGGGGLGVKTPTYLEKFSNLLGFFEKKKPKPHKNFSSTQKNWTPPRKFSGYTPAHFWEKKSQNFSSEILDFRKFFWNISKWWNFLNFVLEILTTIKESNYCQKTMTVLTKTSKNGHPSQTSPKIRSRSIWFHFGFKNSRNAVWFVAFYCRYESFGLYCIPYISCVQNNWKCPKYFLSIQICHEYSKESLNSG